jgi:hypothetical protein
MRVPGSVEPFLCRSRGEPERGCCFMKAASSCQASREARSSALSRVDTLSRTTQRASTVSCRSIEKGVEWAQNRHGALRETLEHQGNGDEPRFLGGTYDACWILAHVQTFGATSGRSTRARLRSAIVPTKMGDEPCATHCWSFITRASGSDQAPQNRTRQFVTRSCSRLLSVTTAAEARKNRPVVVISAKKRRIRPIYSAICLQGATDARL